MPLFPFRLFLRIASKNREVYSLKVVTLAIAFASSTIVILFSLNEFGYDEFHHDARSVFRVLKKNTSELHIGNRLSNKIPVEVYDNLIATSGDFVIVSRMTIMTGLTVYGGAGKTYSKTVHAADPAITDIFSFEVLQGSMSVFRRSPCQAIISSSLADHLFGNAEAIGKTITVCSPEDTVQLQVAAVYRDFPKNGHEKFDVLIRFEDSTIRSLGFDKGESGVYGRAMQSSVIDLEANVMSKVATKDVHYLLQSLPDVYFGPRVLGENAAHGDKYSILILLCLTGFILFLALASYANLTSLTLPHRAKELAVRKLAGSNHVDLFVIFFKESLVIVGISMVLAFFLLFFSMDLIQSIFSIDFVDLVRSGTWSLVVTMGGLLLAVTLSPLVLALRFIHVSPSRLLSTDTITFPRFKRTITIFQLGISIFLIVASLVIKRQISYSLLKEPGRNYDQVVYLDYPADLTKEGLQRTREGWQTYHPNILDVIALSQLPDRINRKEVNSPFYSLSVDPFFPGFFQQNMISGNWFRPNSADSLLVINSRGLREVTGVDAANVIGVIEDISSQFNQPQKPVKYKVDETSGYNYVCVRVLEVDIRRTIKYLSDYFNGARIHILNHRFEEWLSYQDRLNLLSNLLGIVSVVLSCLAIYGLSLSIVRDKLTQIAVRKIFGASSPHIAVLLAREFVKDAAWAIVIFGPVTYIFVKEFLRNFVYSTHLQWQDTVLPVTYCVVVITTLCGFQALALHRNDLSSALKN